MENLREHTRYSFSPVRKNNELTAILRYVIVIGLEEHCGEGSRNLTARPGIFPKKINAFCSTHICDRVQVHMLVGICIFVAVLRHIGNLTFKKSPFFFPISL
jgi:hypothetical protein